MSSHDTSRTHPEEQRATPTACQACAAAKTKCSLQGANRRPYNATSSAAEAARCERCARLDKKCIDQEIKPRPTKRGKYNTKRHADIEQKVDQLFALIGDKQAQSIGTVEADGRSKPSTEKTVRGGSVTINEPNSSCQTETPPLSNSSVLLHYTRVEQKKLLDVFIAQHGGAFPFIILPMGWSVQKYNGERPLLLKIMLTIASYHDSESQKVWAQDILKDITERAFLKGEKTHELLQAALLWTAWYHPFVMNNPQLVNLLHLLQALISDMGLDNYGARFTGLEVWKPTAPKIAQGLNSSAQPRTIEERRTVLGVFFVCSTITTAFGLPELTRPNPFFEESCKILEAEGVVLTDALVCFMVRVQGIVAKANRVLGEEVEDTGQLSAGPVIACIRAYQEGMSTLYNQASDLVRANRQCQLCFHHGRMSIYRLLVDCLARGPSPVHGSMNVFSMLSASAQTVEELCLIFFSTPASAYFSSPCTAIVLLIPSLLMLVKLRSIRYEGWSLEQMHPGLDVLWLLDRAANGCEEVSVEAQINGFPVIGNDLSERWAKRFRLFASMQRAMSSTGPGVISDATQEFPMYNMAGLFSGAGLDTLSMDSFFSFGDLDSLDSSFLQSLMNGAPEAFNGQANAM